METPKPSVPVKSAVPATAPKPKAPERRSAPVRNPAFREHAGLRALQKELNSRPTARKNK